MHMPRNQAQGHEPINIIERSSGWWIAGDNPEGPFDTYEDAAASLTDPAIEHTPERDHTRVQDALDWAFRSGYEDGQAAGEAFARITGKTLVIENGGLYSDWLRFDGEAQAPTLKAENERLRAALEQMTNALEVASTSPQSGPFKMDLQGSREVFAAIAKTGRATLTK